MLGLDRAQTFLCANLMLDLEITTVRSGWLTSRNTLVAVALLLRIGSYLPCLVAGPRGMLLWTVLVVSLVAADPVRRIVIDGDFSDWAQVPKRSDPFRVSATEPSPQDGFPPAPDVHSDEDSEDTCHVRTEAFNPYSDVVEVALAHDEHQFFAYFKSVKSMAFTTSGQGGQAGLLYVQVKRENRDLFVALTRSSGQPRFG